MATDSDLENNYVSGLDDKIMYVSGLDDKIMNGVSLILNKSDNEV